MVAALEEVAAQSANAARIVLPIIILLRVVCVRR